VTPGEDGVLPWQQQSWDRLMAARSSGRFPHALLLSGAPGMGKTSFAYHLGKTLLCNSPSTDGKPCGHCRSCRFFSAGTHPDWTLVTPDAEKKKTDIGIDSIRELIARESLTSQAGAKVICIQPAERLGTAAANSLLKTLEEPTPNTFMILVADTPERLPSTIRSRCQWVVFRPPTRSVALAWLDAQPGTGESSDLLAQAHGAPLRALALRDPQYRDQRESMFEDFAAIVCGRRDPVAVAERWTEWRAEVVLDHLYSWLLDLVRLHLSGRSDCLSNPDLTDRLQGIREALDLDRIFGVSDKILEIKGSISLNINLQMALETVCIRLAGFDLARA